jgi:hypothetical protein
MFYEIINICLVKMIPFKKDQALAWLKFPFTFDSKFLFIIQ